MLRSFIRDIAAIYIGYRLLVAGLFKQNLSNTDMIIFGFILLFFTLWFLLEKIGVLPKIG